MGRRSRSRSGSMDNWGRKRQRRSRFERSDRERGRYRSRERGRSRSRSRSRSVERRRRYSPSPPRRSSRRSPSPKANEVMSTRDFRARILQGEDGKVEDGDKKHEDTAVAAVPEISEEEQMKALMGFSGFDTTKGKEVEDNQRGPAIGTSNVKSKREYRQYMNKRSNFMKPKPPPAM